MPAASRYLLCLVLGLLGSLALFAGLAIAIDPYFIFDAPRVAGINARHPYANSQMVAARSHLAARMRPRTLLLGNSRVEAGFDPQSRAWPEAMRPVFDGGLPGRGLEATGRLVETAVAAGRLQVMLIAVDFFDALGFGQQDDPMPPLQLPPPRLARWQAQAHDWFVATLTMGALANSFQTVADQRRAAINTTRPDGAGDLGEYASFVQQAGGAMLFDHKLAEYRARFRQYAPPDFRHPEGQTAFRSIMVLLDAAHTAGCSVDIIIYPYHATLLDLLGAQGLWPSFEDFKRVLVRLVWSRYPGTRIVDFSGYSAYAMEPRPPAGPGRAMTWYWEPGHFTTALGDRMIRRLYDGVSDFGRELRPDTVEAALAAIRQERDSARGVAQELPPPLMSAN